jgi:hypothetical protein
VKWYKEQFSLIDDNSFMENKKPEINVKEIFKNYSELNRYQIEYLKNR